MHVKRIIGYGAVLGAGLGVVLPFMPALVAPTAERAGAATGTVMNIADGTTAANLAAVDSSHRLSTLSVLNGGTASVRPYVPATPIHGRAGQTSNFYQNGSTRMALTDPSAATIAITRMAWTNAITNASSWEVYLYITQGNTKAECVANVFSISRSLEHLNVPAHETVLDLRADSPMVLKPLNSGQKWCLVTGAGPTQNSGSTADSGNIDLTFDGYTVSGTFLAPTGGVPAAPQSGKAKPALGEQPQ